MNIVNWVKGLPLEACRRFAGMLSVAVMASVTAAPAFAVAPANDDCANAISVVPPGLGIAGSTTGSTFDDVGFCGTSNTTGGVWYKFTAPATGTFRASTCNQANYDTKISVFSGTCGAPVCVAGQDDNFGAGCAGFTTELDFPVTAGTTYNVLVHGFGGATGDFQLDLLQLIGNTFEENLACARDGISALMQPAITGPAQKTMLLGLLGNVERYAGTPYRSLSLTILNAVLSRVDGCDLRGTPDTVLTQGMTSSDFVHDCGSQALINQCLKDARSQLAGP